MITKIAIVKYLNRILAEHFIQKAIYIYHMKIEDVLSRIAQSSLRIPHNASCGCNNINFFLTLP